MLCSFLFCLPFGHWFVLTSNRILKHLVGFGTSESVLVKRSGRRIIEASSRCNKAPVLAAVVTVVMAG